MDIPNRNTPEISPVLAERACGGWLATTPKGYRFSLGVTAETEGEAREAFRRTINRWTEILLSGVSPTTGSSGSP
jgi:hypothetical protein